jgi:UDP-N-acetyl-D-glucosamine dehydrogenase
VVGRVKADFGSLAGKRVLVVGVSYKSNVADTRQTPAELIIDGLVNEGADVSWHDPLVGQWRGESSVELMPGVADVAVVLTLHDVIDGNDVLSAAGYVFDCTGKIAGVPGL